MNPLRVLRTPRGASVALATALVVPMIGTATSPIGDPDVFSIAAIGRDWVTKGRFIEENAYSFTDPSHPWITHEWLPNFVYALGLGRFGPAFFALFALGVFAATFAVVFRATLAPKNVFAGALLSLVALTFSKRFLSARPMAISLLLATLLVALASHERFGPRRAAASIGLVWLWANTHGSFPLGVALLVFAAADAWWRGAREDLRWRALAPLGAALATFVNPYGAKLHAFVFHHLFGDGGGAISTSHVLVSEFAPIWRDREIVGPPELAGSVVLLALAVAALTRRTHAVRGAFVLGLALLGALQVRHVEQFGILGAVLLAPCVDMLWPPPPSPVSSITHRAVSWAVIPPFVLALLCFAIVLSRRTRDEWIGDWVGGPSMADLVRALPDGAKVHAPYPSDTLVLWFAAPRGVRVFFDPRADGYSPDIGFAAVEIADGLDGSDALLRRFGTSHVIARADGALHHRLGSTWNETRRSGPWALLEPKDEAMGTGTRAPSATAR